MQKTIAITLIISGLLPAAAWADNYRYGGGSGYNYGHGSSYTPGTTNVVPRSSSSSSNSGVQAAHISPGQGMRGRAYRQTFGGPRYSSWGRSANFTETKPHHRTWQKRYSKWVNEEQERLEASNVTPCGMYGRSPAACKVTMPYIPWVHGDR